MATTTDRDDQTVRDWLIGYEPRAAFARVIADRDDLRQRNFEKSARIADLTAEVEALRSRLEVAPWRERIPATSLG